MDTITILSIFAFIVILVGLVILREKSDQRFEVKNPDIVLALIIPTIILFATGKIKRFEFGDLSVESAWIDAAQAEINTQITQLNTSLPIQAAQSHAKMSVSEIPKLIENKTQILTFKLGQGNYYAPAITEYFSELYKTPDFKYLLITETDGTFWCIADAKKLAELNTKGVQRFSYRKFTQWLNSGNKESLATLPGFISINNAVIDSMDKIRVLEKMEINNIDQLPAINDQGIFIGMVDRSRLVSSLVLDVSARLK